MSFREIALREGYSSSIKLSQLTPTRNEVVVNLPSGRSSTPEETTAIGFNLYADVVKPGYQFAVIPYIRRLTIANPDVSQALGNVVHLGNTGHRLKFDSSVKADLAEEMNDEIDRAAAEWMQHVPGKDGIVNKMFTQVMVAGALSNEWVPQNDLKGIRRLVLLKPENIRFKYNGREITYDPYQASTNLTGTTSIDGLKKLNTNTYKYYALNGDTDSPYGNPPYLPALSPLEGQMLMLDNIKFLIRQVGVMGFLEFLSEKPDQTDGENDDQYKARLEAYLVTASKRVQEGMRDGVVTGFEGDHSFNFHSVTKNVSGVETLFKQNELQVASGLKQDASMLGRSYGTSETQITIVFNKMISELTNIQNVIKSNLQFGYALHLRLKGYKFKKLTVEFRRSTIQDDLKFQQAREILIRNLNALFYDGVINLEQYAQEAGYDKADQKKPRIVRSEGGDPSKEAEKKKEREKSKDKSDSAVRDKNKPRGTKQGNK